MKNTMILCTIVLCIAFTVGGSMFGQEPAVVYVQRPTVNISRRHGNLRDAQSYIVQAFQKINQAQHANKGQLGGHAQRAKELLIEADAELRQAANVSNAEGR